MINEVDSSRVPYDPLIQSLCGVPYNNHGCPNLGKKDVCTGKRPLINEIINPEEPWYVLATPFPIGKFVDEKIKDKNERGETVHWETYPKPLNSQSMEYLNHIRERLQNSRHEWFENCWVPETSSRTMVYQAPIGVSNIRWWQRRARRMHLENVQTFLLTHSGLVVDMYPEGHGVNITGTMIELGVNLDWRWPLPFNLEGITYRVSIAGTPLLPENGGLEIQNYDGNGLIYVEP